MLNNKYSKIYFKIIERAKDRDHVKVRNDNYQIHHIIPKCIGGTNGMENLVVLNYKEHRVCHCLLIKMQTTKSAEIKMRHAYGFFNKNSRFNGPRYKRGKENIFSTQAIINQTKIRMATNNPMKDPLAQAKRLNSWRLTRANKAAILPRVLKDKFITPKGIFKTKKEIQKILGIPEYTLNTIYNDLDKLPTSNGRASKKLDHLNLDKSKSWRSNGFDLISVS